MLRAIRVALTLLMLPGIAASAQEGDPVNWLLKQAVIANDLARIKTLLSVRRSQDELDFALIAAVGRGRPEVARLLLASGANANQQIAPTGHSSVIVAVRENQLEVLKALLEHSGDPNAIDQLGWRPLHHTVGADYEYPEAIRALVQHGASVDGRDGLQRTVLHRAAGFGHTESVRLLLALGADPSLREKYGNSAADRAEQADHRNIAQLIRAYQGTASESQVAAPNGSTITDITQRDPVEVILSILINWTYGLLPAALLRFLILRRPLGKTTAMWISAGVALFLVVTVTGLAHLAEIGPNMAPVAVWTFLTYTILRAGSRQDRSARAEGELQG